LPNPLKERNDHRRSLHRPDRAERDARNEISRDSSRRCVCAGDNVPGQTSYHNGAVDGINDRGQGYQRRTIVLQAGAIITPSGKDYIRKNGVTVAGSALNKPATVSTGSFIVVGNNATCQSAASTTGWKTLAVSNEHDAALAASQTLKNGITVTCGGESSIVACLLNRNPDVRAAVITKATNLLTLTTVMSPQVVCLDSSGWSFGDILKLLRSLSAANRPQGWKEIV
jgi:hypothetical protein